MILLFLLVVAFGFPTVCKNAVECPSETLQFTLNNQITQTPNRCENTAFTRPSVFYTLKGNGLVYYIDTCQTTQGETEIEVFESCTSTTCEQFAMTECGNQQYVTYQSVVGKDAIFRVSCLTASCNVVLTLHTNKTQRNDFCEDALQIKENTNIEFITDTFIESKHGCDGTPFNSRGKWLVFSPEEASYTIQAATHSLSKISRIEAKSGCANYYCDISRLGELTISPKTMTYVFVEGNPEEKTSVKITKVAPHVNEACDSALEIEVPFSGVFSNTYHSTQRSTCGNSSHENVWFTFNSELYKDVTISTCFEEFGYQSYLEFTSGECGSLQCVSNASPSANCFGGFEETIIVDDNKKYLFYIGSALEQVTGYFQVTVRTNSVPEYSVPENAIVISSLARTFSKTIDSTKCVNSLLVDTDVSKRTLKGAFFVLQENPNTIVAITTCSSSTQIENVITTANGAYNDGTKNNIVLNDYSLYTDHRLSPCGVKGTALVFNSSSIQTYPLLFFIGGVENSAGLIKVDFVLDFPVEPTSSESSESGFDFLPVYITLGVFAGIVLLLIFVVGSYFTYYIIIKKRNEKYQLFETSTPTK
ncbi:hypothetical protein EIN_411500 [Entamoeba invadens IP1]|uniref:Uncharacterized protein n=1 Tax=Entamoeba invadens IP1 TaxID=370355 RepID=A0A0A1U170_ENTIV|nr:hypothetical protein EIN_411500 [Entamoeba invadens IP1]ELP87797.1 hypothetical protein EIN_411500 [Entamoeba invadens IP1]|eukprot:XP_004254568.1 hypothetical protein EIN_411500 [Entamoeba invadens IP1]